MSTPSNDLGISQAGYCVFDGTATFFGRTLQAGSGITLSNANGILGNTSITASGNVPLTFTGNSGIATPSLNNLNIITSNTTVKLVGSGSTVTQNFGLTNLLLGSSGSAITSASANAALGSGALAALTGGATNVAIGSGAGAAITSANSNTIVGANSGNHLTTGGGNVVLGQGALNVLTTGASNIVIGNFGTNYTTSESYNILIGNSGVNAESNVIRIGTQGTGANQQSQCFVAGVLNTTSGQTVNITTPGGYPYTTLTTDYVILVDSSVARTITPLASPATGTTYRIKDNVGSAAANHITITPSGKNIDGAASFVISTNFGSADITYNGTQWNVL